MTLKFSFLHAIKKILSLINANLCEIMENIMLFELKSTCSIFYNILHITIFYFITVIN